MSKHYGWKILRSELEWAARHPEYPQFDSLRFKTRKQAREFIAAHKRAVMEIVTQTQTEEEAVS